MEVTFKSNSVSTAKNNVFTSVECISLNTHLYLVMSWGSHADNTKEKEKRVISAQSNGGGFVNFAQFPVKLICYQPPSNNEYLSFSFDQPLIIIHFQSKYFHDTFLY